MSEWRETTVAELASPGAYALATGPFGSAISSKHFVDEGVPVLRGSNLSLDIGVRLLDEGLAFLKREKAATFKRSLARRGDLVFTCWGTIGQVGLVDRRAKFDEYVVSNKQMKYTPDPSKADSLFLYYLLSSPAMVQKVQNQSIGAAVPGFNLGQLREIRLRVPPLDVQKKIARVLDAIDELIENNRQRMALLEQMVQTIYREWFVRFRYPGHESTTFVDSPLGPIPESWEIVPLAAIAKVNSESRRPGSDETIRYLDISALGDRVLSTPVESSGADAPSRARRVVRSGDIVWSMVRPGRRAHALLVCPGNNWIASTGLAVLRPSVLSSSLLFESVSAIEFSQFLVSRESGSAYPAVRPKDFESVPIRCPTRELDRKFDAMVAPMHRSVWSLRECSEHLASLRNLLLPRLVTGQIDLSGLDLDIEVRSVA
jgi:type I restriction enzyme, S subunit